MSKTETKVNNLKINTGTYANIEANINSIGENELIITDDKNIPIPSVSDNGKIVSVSSGDYTLSELKTINSTNIIGTGNIDTKELYYCTYGTTTYAQITQALSDGKLPVCIYSNRFYKYDLKSPTNRYIFNALYADSLYSLNIQSNDTWGTGSYQLEVISNKTQVINNSSTTSQYPSAKAVYDYTQPKLTAGNNITISSNTISATNTNQTIKVGNTTFGADDVIELIAGTNITLTPDTTNKTITITSTGGGGGITNGVAYEEVV